ncbi:MULTISPECIES: M23 family metallopeptidase [Sphingomonas]|uniref:M23 family metallopeptidase n=1 Tax=Sphingomonas TaxID=13687 RepID=UPI001047D313|nr:MULTISPECIES: M23 family metallopeptidase [Sphingomonas]TCQ05635.1 murein DD-endopeptidase MepM/ murein hydrolase activator NlpD [Sphingomonas sp. PP-CC-3A-396]
MFLRDDQRYELAGVAVTRGPVLRMPSSATLTPRESPVDILRGAATRIDWVPDLGARIGSLDWWRGLATCTALCAASWALSPGIKPLVGAVPPPLAGAEWDEARAQGITAIGQGAATGRRMAANDLVAPLAEVPERPTVELSATLGQGDRLDRVLMRAGVGRPDADAAAALVAQAVPLDDIAAGTRIALTLGRRPDRTVTRPLEALDFRARFDLGLALARTATGLAMHRKPIAIDATPLRIQGLVGSSLYRSMRAAGVPAKAVESYIKAIATRVSIGRDVDPADSFDLIIQRQRAATGETRIGDLLFAGIDQGRHKVQLVRFGPGGADADGGGDGDAGAPPRTDGWFDANGQTERRAVSGLPVSGRITSNFGLRMHPLLGFTRMHKGLDIGAPYGAPIHAMTDGIVAFAGRTGGYGNFVKLMHGGGMASGYGHMSRIAVSSGTRVRQGQVIGYVGSTGMSTGPHLHWEVWKNGAAINPRSVSFASVAQLSGASLRAFRAKVAALLAVRTGT